MKLTLPNTHTRAKLTHQSGKSSAVFVLVIAIAIGIGILVQQSVNAPVKMPVFEKLIIMPNPKPLGTVSLVDHDGAAFTEKNLADKWTIMFFAFTNCPDICPNTLFTLKQVKQDLVAADAWSPFQLAMVSVDPARDTPERLKQYVPFFDPEFIGLTGELDYITKFAKNLGVLFFKKEVLADGNYDVDHSAGLILVNPKGQFAGFLGVPHERKSLSADLTKLGKHIIKTQEPTNTRSAVEIDEPGTAITAVEPVPMKNSIEKDIDIVDAWIRPAPPSAVSMAGYLTIKNNRDTAITINDLESPLFNMTMVHETIVEDGVASMNHLDNLTIEAGGSATFAPMGIHMMMMGPKEPLAVGRKVPVTLILRNDEAIDIEIEVRNNPNEQ